MKWEIIYLEFLVFDGREFSCLNKWISKKNSKNANKEINKAEQLKKSMKMKNITTFKSHLDSQYGEKELRLVKYEEEYEAFKLGVLLQKQEKKWD